MAIDIDQVMLFSLRKPTLNQVDELVRWDLGLVVPRF